MRKQLCISVIVTMAWSLQAQEAKPVVIVSATGKVALIPQNETKGMEIESGAVAKSTGQLSLAKGAKAVVYCSGQFQNVKGGQTIALSSICGDAPTRRKVNFDYEFGSQIMAAVEVVAVAKSRGDGWANAIGDHPKSGDGWGTAIGDHPKSGDGWGTAIGDHPKSGDGWGTAIGDHPKSGDGWGGNGSKIKLIMPFGKLCAAPITFTWSKPAGANAYQLEILDNDKIVHSISVKDTFARIDLKTLKLGTGKKFHWKVSSIGDKPLNSNELEFAIGSKAERTTALLEAKNSNVSSSSKSPALKGLAEAIALENGQWKYDAQQKYVALKRKHSDNIIQIMYAAFWMRYGFNHLAQKAVQG